ncbi:MAG: hypothetical protein AB1646_21255 [Thermodesulfobacteriota bacterium]
METEIVRRTRVVYKGIELLLTDYRGLTGPQFLDQMRENVRQMLAEVAKGRRDYLQIIDLSGIEVPYGGYATMRELTLQIEPYILARAVVGVTGPRRFVLKAINSLLDTKIAAFDSVEEAMDWLVSKVLREKRSAVAWPGR